MKFLLAINHIIANRNIELIIIKRKNTFAVNVFNFDQINLRSEVTNKKIFI